MSSKLIILSFLDDFSIIFQVKRIKNKRKPDRNYFCGMETIKFFAEVKDFRINRKKLYSLPEILLISLCAVVSGAEDFEEIAEYGRQKLSFLKTFYGITQRHSLSRHFQPSISALRQRCVFVKFISLVEGTFRFF
ncbi:MAG: transposase family protein [Sphingobacteriales bacterium]|nr:transposase family protein [Sphingobacteriales bacterium]